MTADGELAIPEGSRIVLGVVCSSCERGGVPLWLPEDGVMMAYCSDCLRGVRSELRTIAMSMGKGT